MNEKIFGLAIAVVMITSCGGTSGDGEAASEEKLPTETQLIEDYDFPRTVSNVPYPGWDLYTILTRSGDGASAGNLVPVGLSLTAAETERMACVMGMMLTDLVYLCTLNDMQRASPHMEALSGLLIDAGLDGLLAQHGGPSLPDDSGAALQKVNRLYMALYDHLQEEGRMAEVALMLTGSWVQAEHHSLSLAKSENRADNEFFESDHGHHQFEQKSNLFNLIQTLEAAPGSPVTADLLAGLRSLYDVYADILSGDDIPTHLEQLQSAVSHIRDGILDGFQG